MNTLTSAPPVPSALISPTTSSCLDAAVEQLVLETDATNEVQNIFSGKVGCANDM